MKQPPASRPSAVPLLLAGALTAGMGLGAGWLLWAPGGILNPAPLDLSDRMATLAQRVTDSETAVHALSDSLQTARSEIGQRQDAAETDAAGLKRQMDLAQASLSGLPALDEAVRAQENRSIALTEALSGLEERLTDLAQRPPASDPAAIAIYEREMAAIRQGLDTELAALRQGTDDALAGIRETLAAEMARLEAEQQAASELRDESTELHRQAEIAAARAALSAALDAGTALEPALERLTAAAPSLDLAPLAPFREGVASLLALQQDFPVAARAALSAEAASGGGSGGISGALKGFLGVRTLSPQEGGSTDAILSRAEAALTSGDLSNALAELDALPAVPAAELAGWRTAAATRLAALTAHATLSDAVEK